MNRDYSKFLELINQDAEKGRNKKAEKAVHDNLYNKGFRDGLAVLDKIRAEIEQLRLHKAQFITSDGKVCIDSQDILDIIDKYKAESENKWQI